MMLYCPGIVRGYFGANLSAVKAMRLDVRVFFVPPFFVPHVWVCLFSPCTSMMYELCLFISDEV